MNAALWRGVLVGALAGLMFGFDTAVIAGTTAGLREAFALDATGVGITVSSALWGTLAGALLSGKPGDAYGARTCLRWVAALYLLSGVGCALAWNWPSLVLFRFMAGLAVGASSVLAPVYITEIAPPKRRGALVGAFQLNIVLGILIAYLSNYLVGTLDLGGSDWRVKFGMTVLPAAILLTLSFTIAQSPRWLARMGRVEEAEAGMRRLGVPDPAAELAMLTANADQGQSRLSWSRHRRPILLAITIAAFNQLSGINAILYYLNDIFAAAGYDRLSADRQAIVIGTMNLIFTALALTVIDRWGRKALLLIGSVGLTLSLAGVGLVMLTGAYQHYLLWLLIGFIAFFAFSQGAVIWVYISEIFPTEVRARGQSLGSSTHWFMDAIIAFGFPVIAALSPGIPFIVFAAMMLLQFFVVAFLFPETKGRSVDAALAGARSGG